MRILVVGSGGREHALCWALRRTTAKPLELFCAPGNAGIAEIAECVPIRVNDVNGLAAFVEDSKIDLTMVGPEGPLAAGIVDYFENRNLSIVGPARKAARLESSKAFAKEFMHRHGIPTARFHNTSSVAEALAVLASGEFGEADSPVVVKADGLAAGKGVVVAQSRLEAVDAVRALAGGGVDASAVQQIVIEEALVGTEASLLLFSDGKDYSLMPAARDHKRLGESDTGPNTGGMGSITHADILSSALRDRVVRQIVELTLDGATSEGFPFKGILFIGLMLTTDGPRVLEYNVRFGDPETQAIVLRLRSDFVEILAAIHQQRLGELRINWSEESSACVVLAAKNYPGKPETGAVIKGLDAAGQCENAVVFHAGTARDSNRKWLTSGGRVLGVSAAASDLDLALAKCYRAISEISWEGMQFRTDIGQPTALGATPTRS